MFFKTTFKDRQKLKYLKSKWQSISVLFYISKVANLLRKNAYISRIQAVRQVIYIIFKSPLGKL